MAVHMIGNQPYYEFLRVKRTLIFARNLGLQKYSEGYNIEDAISNTKEATELFIETLNDIGRV